MKVKELKELLDRANADDEVILEIDIEGSPEGRILESAEGLQRHPGRVILNNFNY